MESNKEAGWGLSSAELATEIERLMSLLDQTQEDEEHFGQYTELMRMTAVSAYYRAAELIEANNERIAQQLAELGIRPPAGN